MTSSRALALLAAVAAGGVQLLAHPPMAWAWLAFLAPALLALAVTVSDLRPASLGFVAGVILYVPLLSWLRFRATIVGWLLLALVMAAWMALLAWGLHHLLQRRWTMLLAPLWWVGIDAWRNTVPWDGFGWATLGITQVGNDWLVPLGRVFGEKGHTLVVVALSLAAWAAVQDGLAARSDADAHRTWLRISPREGATTTGANGDRATGDQVVGPGNARQDPDRGWTLLSDRARGVAARAGEGATPGMLALAGVMMAVTLVTIEAPARVGTIDVVAVQPNDMEVPAADVTTGIRRLADQSLALTRDALAQQGPADLVVWPEGAIGRDPARDPHLQEVLDEAGALTRGRLLVGTDLEDPDSDGFHRVSIVVDEDGGVSDTYVKQVLVPFGEYVPLRSLLDWYPALHQIPRDAIPGTRPHNVVVPQPDGRDLVVAVAICFETLYPQTVADNIVADDRVARLLVSSTSSSSYGRSGQPEQHLSQARMRAIEVGRWTVHATSSGVTALVDQAGEVLTDRTRLFTQDWVRGEVGLADGLTPFVRMGDVLAPTTRTVAGLVLVVLLVSLWRRRRRRDDGSDTTTAATDRTSLVRNEQ